MRPHLVEPCCPAFDRVPWDGTRHRWTGRLFARTTVPQILHIPLGLPGRMRRLMERIERAGAMPASDASLVLMRELSPWRSEILVALATEVPGLASVRLSGTFLTKVFDGPYRDAPVWMAETDAALAQVGERAQRHYLRYAYCPKCARRFGHNFVTVFAQLG